MLLKLLRCYDDEIAILALDVITALALPPQTHRSINFSAHTTAMHKSASNCAPMFQIVEAANWSFTVSAEEFLSNIYPLNEKFKNLELDISQKPRGFGTTDTINDTSPEIAQSLLVIPDIQNDPRNIQTILAETCVPPKCLFALMWRIRLMRKVTTLEGRIEILKQQYRSILILLCCHPNSSVLSHFFQDKTDLLRDFVFMLRTGSCSSSFFFIPTFPLRYFVTFFRPWFN